MADYTERTEKYYVVKVSKNNARIMYVNMNQFNGLLTEREDKEGMGFDDAVDAQTLVGSLNNLYEKYSMNFHCYRVSNVENSTHVIRNLPEDYQAIVNAHFGVVEEAPPTDETTPQE
ncbi:hypothetical protein ACBR55_12015 [Salinicoccus roseus]|uniref:hypothetical protein n=1 Tax=Salinicoccus roseus TaxID=45670 RepID=UPI003525A55C